MFGLGKNRSCADRLRAASHAAARSVFEPLEGRALFSAAPIPAELPSSNAFHDHALTQEQMDALGLVTLNWKGQDVYAKAGEWIVKLDRGGFEPIRYTPGGEPIFNPTLRGTIDTTPRPEHQRFFETAGPEVTFGQYLGAPDYLLVKAPPALGLEQLQGALRNLPDFSYAEPNTLQYTTASVPNDTSFGQQWGMEQSSDKDIDAADAWDITRGSSGTVVAVIDTGVKWDHADLAGNMWSNPGEVAGNAIDDDGNGYADDVYGWDFGENDSNPMDVVGHGTHVAGTVAAVGDNNTGVAGTAWDASIMALKFADANGVLSTTGAINAVNYATLMRQRGVNIRITNNNWGGGSYNQTLYDAIESARDTDMLFVAAAGNGGADDIGDDNDATPFYPASYNLANIISVAATDQNDDLTSFSNYGAASVDLAAPASGSSVREAVPTSRMPAPPWPPRTSRASRHWRSRSAPTPATPM